MIKKIVTGSILVAAVILVAGLYYTHKPQSLDTAKLNSFFNALSSHNKNMGSLIISSNGKVVYQKTIGYSQVNDSIKRPTTIKTKYRIGSISKMFTAVMVFQLIEERKLSLSTTLATYYPQLPNATKITISEMLDHRSGLYNFTSDTLYSSYETKPQSEAAMLSIMQKEKPAFEPDAKAEYSNTNFILLGYIVEKITGKPYPEELKKRITSKIGLTDTYYGGKINAANNEAYSYSYQGEWKQEPETDMSIPGGAGALVSTPTDLVKFIEALFGGKLISQNSLNQMKTMRDNFGMAMFIMPFDDKKSYGHSGGIDDFSSMLTYFPDERLAISYISNGAVYSTNDVMIAALSIYFKKPFTIPEFKTITLKTADLDKYLGYYKSTQMPLKIKVTKNNATLIVQATGQRPSALDALGGDKFAISRGAVTIQFDPQIGEFTIFQGDKTYLYRKVK